MNIFLVCAICLLATVYSKELFSFVVGLIEIGLDLGFVKLRLNKRPLQFETIALREPRFYEQLIADNSLRWSGQPVRIHNLTSVAVNKSL